MKKLIALLLALTMAVSMAACASKTTEEPEVDTPAVEAPVEETPAEETPVEETPAIDEPAAMPEEPAENPEEMPVAEPMPAEKLEELTGIMDQLTAGNEEMKTMTSEITADQYSYFAVPQVEGVYAVVSSAMINVFAHEVVLIEMPEGTDMEAAAAEVEANQDTMKWICVNPETNWVKTSGQYIVAVMSNQDIADTVAANFDTVFGA